MIWIWNFRQKVANAEHRFFIWPCIAGFHQGIDLQCFRCLWKASVLVGTFGIPRETSKCESHKDRTDRTLDIAHGLRQTTQQVKDVSDSERPHEAHWPMRFDGSIWVLFECFHVAVSACLHSEKYIAVAWWGSKSRSVWMKVKGAERRGCMFWVLTIFSQRRQRLCFLKNWMVSLILNHRTYDSHWQSLSGCSGVLGSFLPRCLSPRLVSPRLATSHDFAPPNTFDETPCRRQGCQGCTKGRCQRQFD